VKLEQHLITILREHNKTDRLKKIPISPYLRSILAGLPRHGEFVFQYKGKPLKDIRTAFQVALARAGIVNFHFHDFRHCFVTRKRKEGIPDRVIMAITGHKTFECFRRYDTISFEDLKEAVGVEKNPGTFLEHLVI